MRGGEGEGLGVHSKAGGESSGVSAGEVSPGVHPAIKRTAKQMQNSFFISFIPFRFFRAGQAQGNESTFSYRTPNDQFAAVQPHNIIADR